MYNNQHSRKYVCEFSTSAPLGALVLLVALDVCLFARLSHLLMSNSGATSKWNYDGFC